MMSDFQISFEILLFLFTIYKNYNINSITEITSLKNRKKKYNNT